MTLVSIRNNLISRRTLFYPKLLRHILRLLNVSGASLICYFLRLNLTHHKDRIVLLFDNIAYFIFSTIVHTSNKGFIQLVISKFFIQYRFMFNSSISLNSDQVEYFLFFVCKRIRRLIPRRQPQFILFHIFSLTSVFKLGLWSLYYLSWQTSL